MIPEASRQRLQVLAGDKVLQWVSIIACPRTRATALLEALAEGADAHRNHPYCTTNLKGMKWDYQGPAQRSEEAGSTLILKCYDETAKPEARQVKLVTHDVSQNLSETDFKEIAAAASHLIFVLRQPILQGLSQLTRFTNDRLVGPLKREIRPDEVLKLIKDDQSFADFIQANPARISLGTTPPEDLKKVRQEILNLFLEQFSLCWDNMYHHVMLAQKEYGKHLKTIVDGDWMTDNPAQFLKDLTARVACLAFSPKMVQGWSKANGDNFRCEIMRKLPQDIDKKNNGWNGHAQMSSGISVQEDGVNFPVELESLPHEIQNAVKEREALYQQMINFSHRQ